MTSRLARQAMLRLIAAGFLPLGGITFAAVPSLPLQDGEHLTYRVSWAIVRGAGEIQIEAHRDSSAREHLVVTTSTATRGIARMLMSFDAKAESNFDLPTGKLLSLHEWSQTRGKEADHSVTFDYAKRRANYTAKGKEPLPALAMPEGNPTDLIMALLQTRTWDLKPGEKRDALVLFDDEFYELTLHAVRYEDIDTPLGTFKTLVLEPRMEKTPPKGMFKRGSKVRVWIAQDSQHLPVRFDVEFNIGTGTAVLAAYEPSASAKAAKGRTPTGKPAGDGSPAGPKDAKNSRP